MRLNSEVITLSTLDNLGVSQAQFTPIETFSCVDDVSSYNTSCKFDAHLEKRTESKPSDASPTSKVFVSDYNGSHRSGAFSLNSADEYPQHADVDDSRESNLLKKTAKFEMVINKEEATSNTYVPSTTLLDVIEEGRYQKGLLYSEEGPSSATQDSSSLK